MEQCKYCGARLVKYIKPFKINNPIHKYSFHYGSECEACGRWQKWEKQEDDLLDKKFYATHNTNK
jgi:hypothetical protein